MTFKSQYSARNFKTAFYFFGIISMSLQYVLGLDLVTYDLRRDWSTNSNPNGVWTYRAGSEILPVYSWGASFPTFQPSWENNSPGNLPAWIFSTTNPIAGNDWQIGDVVVHTQDDNLGAGNGQANVIWTSPFTGTINISGGVWIGRDIERANIWNLYVRDTLINSGSIFSGDPYSRESPYLFRSGSGGTNSVENVKISTGDQVILEIDRNSVYGDYVGVNLTIVETIPDPNLSVGCSQVAVCTDTISNLWYQFQYRTNLNDTIWFPLTTNYFQGNGSRYCLDDATLPDQRFYRVSITNSLPSTQNP